MEKIRTEVNQKVNLELSLRAFLTYGLFSLSGVLGIVAGVIFGQVLGYNDPSVIIIFVACSLLVGLGVWMAVLLVIKSKRYSAQENVVETEFLEDSVFSISYKKGEKTGESKIKYGEFLYYRETADYVYLFPNKVTALPLNKVDGLVAFLEEKGIKKKKF